LLGLDIFLEARKQLPLDLVGMNTGDMGLGEVLHPQLPAFLSRYRFFFNPIRWTSLGLSICEAMMLGMPVAGLATTELSSVLQNERSGIIHTDLNYLVDQMKLLLKDKELAFRMGQEGRVVARKRFSIDRFTDDWKRLFKTVINQKKRKVMA
jgi:glycosyltransferase involved in cell wall biosynthesis